MAEKNGRNKTILYLISIIVGIVIFTAMPTMASYIITNDKASRDRDSCIVEAISNNQIDIVQRLTRIETKLEKK